MSVNAISKDIQDTIDRMMSTVDRGDLDSAIVVLNQSEFNEGQKAKIADILKGPRSDMLRRIVAVVENITSTVASIDQAPSEQRCISFANNSKSPFGNAYPCKFEFGGKYYQSATACFFAQQYTDRPEIMNFFTTLNPEEAPALAKRNLMTKESKISRENPHAEHVNKDDVLMHVLRAKFGQNTDLKKQLLETGTAYLVCQDHDLYLSDNMDGSGKNALGTSLMRLRGEYGGTNQVAPPAAYHSTKQSLLATSHFIGNELYPDIMGRLFYTCISRCDFITLTATACLNKYWNSRATDFLDVHFDQVCPELTILDAKAQEVKCEDEPKINKFRLLKWARDLSPRVEGNAGVTQLTMTKGTTLNQLIEIAKAEGFTVNVLWGPINDELGDVPVEKSYGILITNSVFKESRDINIELQKTLAEGHGCEMPTVQEYVALCVFTHKVFKKYLYGDNPATYGRSSTQVMNLPLFVGGSESARLYSSFADFDFVTIGAGGKKKF